MDFEAFKRSLDAGSKPPNLKPLLEALWLEANGDWSAAHTIAQELPDEAGGRLHAYLHRKEGDASNAGYWYERAGRPFCQRSLDEEWGDLVRESLDKS